MENVWCGSNSAQCLGKSMPPNAFIESQTADNEFYGIRGKPMKSDSNFRYQMHIRYAQK